MALEVQAGLSASLLVLLFQTANSNYNYQKAVILKVKIGVGSITSTLKIDSFISVCLKITDL